jgi:hypothetical protein
MAGAIGGQWQGRDDFVVDFSSRHFKPLLETEV